MISPGRAAAFDVLLRVDTQDAFAGDALVALTQSFSPLDAGLAEEITFGVLRYRAQLDHIISMYSRGKLDPEVRTALRMGIYQLRYLDRIPPYAAVTESVELVKRARKRSAMGLVNAILRKVNREPVAWPDRATELSMPEWILERWDAEFGTETATGIARAALQRPETYVRNVDPSAALKLEPAEVPGSYKVLDWHASGARVQDIGSQSIVPLLELEPGQTFLDLCAAPGNKTAHALESGVKAIACDVHLHRVRNIDGCDRVVLDARLPLPFRRRFDRVLVDAPCSGTGTLARNPEIKWKLRPADIDELHGKQVEILTQALTAVATGGRLVYSTCSLERQENQNVVAEVLAGGSSGRLLRTQQRVPGIQPGDGFFAAVIERIG